MDRPKTVTVGGVKYYIECLSLERLYANLAVVSEEATTLHLRAIQDKDNPEWVKKAEEADKSEKELRDLIRAKRGEDGKS